MANLLKDTAPISLWVQSNITSFATLTLTSCEIVVYKYVLCSSMGGIPAPHSVYVLAVFNISVEVISRS